MEHRHTIRTNYEAMLMQCTIREIANVILVRVDGRVDHTTATAFEEALLPQLRGCTGEAQKALLDLSGVVYMSSAGLRVLMLAAKQCRRQQGEIVVAALSPILQEVFKISRFDLVFGVFETVRAALEAIAPAAAAMYDRL